MDYLTLVGNHDHITKASNGLGAVRTIFMAYKNAIKRVYLFVTTSKKGAMNYDEIAGQCKAFMQNEKPEVEVNLISIELTNPVDFDLVYPKLLQAVTNVLSKKNKSEERIINITSGTPTMTACWVLLHKSGLIPNSKLIQSFETKYARDRGKSCQVVNLEIENFPNIKVPEDLRLKLDIANREKKELTERLATSELDSKIPELVGTSRQIREIKDIILHEIDKQTHVLITGERGTGKQEVAEAIWRTLGSGEGMETFNCGAWSAELVVSELFGYKKGAFTGADQDKTGIIKKSDGKLLFLDEIGNLPVHGQHAMLRLLQFGEIQPHGAGEVEKMEVQIVAATNKDIDDENLFAQDLKDRFPVKIQIPPLKERKEDIPLLVNHFIKMIAGSRQLKSPFIISKEVIAKLMEYDWPGNVRDLYNWVRVVTTRFDGGEITLDRLPDRLITDIVNANSDITLPDLPLPTDLESYTKEIIDKARQISGGKSKMVDELLRQKEGTEKARRYRERKKVDEG